MVVTATAECGVFPGPDKSANRLCSNRFARSLEVNMCLGKYIQTLILCLLYLQSSRISVPPDYESIESAPVPVHTHAAL